MGLPDCADVCDELADRRNLLGFEISDDDDHSDVLNALSECWLIPTRFVVPDKAGYLHDDRHAKVQEETESKIEGLISRKLKGKITGDECVELGQRIFWIVARKLRPDFFDKFNPT